MRKGRLATLIIGGFIALVGFGSLVAGSGLLWANETERTADGFFSTSAIPLSTESYALTSPEIDLGSQPGDWFPSGRLATVRLGVEGDHDVFVGIGRPSQIDAYLDDVTRTAVTRITDEAVRYRHMTGDRVPSPPDQQTFWVASASGPGTQTVTWDLEAGRWAVVIMNTDASTGVAVEASAGAQTELLVPFAFGLLAVGAVLLAIALVLFFSSVRGTAAQRAPVAEGFGRYPVKLEAELDPKLSRWQWLFKWLLAIPHFIALFFLWTAFLLLTIVAWFAIVFTGRYPRSIFEFNVGVLRWSWRVGYYSYAALGTDQYPPFTLADIDYPSHFDVAYPEHLSRGLALVKTWLLAIPHYLIVGLLSGGLVGWTTEIGERGNVITDTGTGLTGILVLIAAVILLFGGRYPQGLFDLIIGLNRWVFRVIAYAALMTDEYPPFRLDTGGTEPGTAPPGDPSPSDSSGAVSQPSLTT